MATRPCLRIGLIGFGAVGRAFARALDANAARLTTRIGSDVRIARIAVRNPDRIRELAPLARIGDDAAAVAEDRGIDLLVEASGDPAADEWMGAALARQAAVITANKLALASSHALMRAIACRDPLLHCEGAVAAAVPVVRALRDSLDGEEIHEIRGVLNGTTTFVLSAIERGHSFEDALAQAVARGFAESTGAGDLDGQDAAAKLAILATLAWRTPILIDRVRRRGFDAGVEDLVREAATRGRRIRLVAEASRDPLLGPNLVVEPRLLDTGDPLATVDDVTNAVEIRAELAGRLTWFGPGAGGDRTASALLGDLIAAAQALCQRSSDVRSAAA